MTTPAIGELDLHAYVDGQLDPARRAEVEGYLAAHPEAVELVGQFRQQMHALHASYDPVLNEPIPPTLKAVLGRRQWPLRFAAVFVWLSVGTVVGWLAHGMWAPQPNVATAFARNALAAHVVYSAEQRHPVEVPAEQEAHLIAWLSKRLDTPIRAPDLRSQGFALLGGRLLPGEGVPLAQLMYQTEKGERLTLTVRKAEGGARDTGFKIIAEGKSSVFYWVDHDYGYALSGGIDRGRLLTVARSVESQLRSTFRSVGKN